jgi:hypothetical protein
VGFAALIFLSLTSVQAQDKAIKILYQANVDPIGVAPGQMLRLTVSNPGVQRDQDSAAQRSTVRSVVVVFDSQNNPIARTDEVEIPMNGFHSFDIKREEISLAGEPRTGRLQLRAEVEIVLLTTSAVEAREFEASLSAPTSELIDNASGRTTAAGGLVRLGTGRILLQGHGNY